MNQFAKDIIEGLTSSPKYLSSKYFYDERGDKLFQQIMKLPEYYLTRSEFEIFDQHKDEMLQLFRGEENTRFDLTELGAGDGFKTKILLRHMVSKSAEFTYKPVDISAHVLETLQNALHQEIPDLKVETLNKEYFQALEEIKQNENKRNIILFLGSNIGNFVYEKCCEFLGELKKRMTNDDLLMIGIDLKKDPNVIRNAYNDSTGVTKAFNFNLLNRINRELKANFELDDFIHYPTYNPASGEARSYMVSRKDQTVYFPENDLEIKFSEWEPIFVEVSKKYSKKELAELADNCGFEIVKSFYDCKHYFTNTVWRPKT